MLGYERAETEEEALEEIISFFNNLSETGRLSMEVNKHISKETPIKFLLMIDNVEDLIANDGH